MMQIIRNISNNKRRTLRIYTLTYVANIPANNVGDVSETAINYSRNRMLQQSSTDHAHPKPLSRTKIIRLLCILSTYGQVLSFRCGSSVSKVTKKTPHWTENEISEQMFRLEIKRSKFDLQNEHVAYLPFTV
jgi:hypothetical protein